MNGEDIPGAPPRAGDSDDALFAALIKADRSESLGRLAAGLGKELNELLMAILGGIETARAAEDPALTGAKEACLAARELTRRLVALGRGGDGLRSDAGPREILLEAAKGAGAGSPVEIEVSVPDDIPLVAVDRGQVIQAFQSLILNAIEAMHPPPRRPKVQLRATRTVLEEGRVSGIPAGAYVEFEVRDNGSGIAPENTERIWEPFFTTKKHGAGLGLPTALAIVRRHAGQIGVDSTLGVGTVFTVFLPASGLAGAASAERAATARFRTGRILIMDDDRKIAALTGSLLDKLDYKFDLASNGDDALAWYRRYFDVGRPYDAVLLDLDVVGGMGGAEAFEALRAMDPDVRAIATHSGDPELVSAQLPPGFSGCLAKPYGAADLGRVLGTILGA